MNKEGPMSFISIEQYIMNLGVPIRGNVQAPAEWDTGACVQSKSLYPSLAIVLLMQVF